MSIMSELAGPLKFIPILSFPFALKYDLFFLNTVRVEFLFFIFLFPLQP